MELTKSETRWLSAVEWSRNNQKQIYISLVLSILLAIFLFAIGFFTKSMGAIFLALYVGTIALLSILNVSVQIKLLSIIKKME